MRRWPATPSGSTDAGILGTAQAPQSDPRGDRILRVELAARAGGGDADPGLRHPALDLVCLLESNPSEALDWYRRTENSTFRMMGEAMAFHDTGDALRSLDSLQVLIDQDAHHAAYQVASVFAWRGENDAAFEWLQHALEQRDAGLQYLKYDAALRGLRHDARYAQLLQRMRLPA